MRRRGLFHTLNRLARWAFIIIFLAGLTGLGHTLWNFKPLRLWAAILAENSWEKHPWVGEVSGMATRVLTGDIFQMRAGGNGAVYSVRLTGVRVPAYVPAQSTRADRERIEASRKFLSGLVLSNQVDLRVTWAGRGSALGIAFVGETNVNAAVVGQGFGVSRPEWIRNLPLRVQYQMLRSEQLAREKGLGVWNTNETIMAKQNIPKN